MPFQILDLEQGCEEWFQLRKTKITATDAPVIMGASPWKTIDELYCEKTSDTPNGKPNDRMKRGTDLEPVARELFAIQTGLEIYPKVVVKDWCMASMDGLSPCCKYAVEIKCPSEKAHEIAVCGEVPTYYYPQLQHQIWVCDLDMIYYYSFDGIDGVIVEVQRNEEYIENMIKEERKFYECILDRRSPIEA